MSDGYSTYIMFNYDHLMWTTGTTSQGNPASGLGGKGALVSLTYADKDVQTKIVLFKIICHGWSSFECGKYITEFKPSNDRINIPPCLAIDSPIYLV